MNGSARGNQGISGFNQGIMGGGGGGAENGESGRYPILVDPVDRLKYFLASAPTEWTPGTIAKRFGLGNGETVSCILWKGLFYITGTDIVKILLFRFQMVNRPVINTKKFEEGIFSDLRNLKPGLDATLEEPRSEFLEVLYRNGCIRTQKKQKVFYWYSVPHERLFMDALERDLKRESNLLHVNAFLGTRPNPQPLFSPNFFPRHFPMLLHPVSSTMSPLKKSHDQEDPLDARDPFFSDGLYHNRHPHLPDGVVRRPFAFDTFI